MNEEALKDAYEYFYRTGYSGSIMEFRNLLNTNKDAVNDAYKYFADTGYKGDLNAFKDLMGVEPLKKKEERDTFTPFSEKESKFTSALGSDFDPDEKAYEEYLDRKNKEAISKIREIRPDLDFPTKDEYYGLEKAPKLEKTTKFKDVTDISAAETKAREERKKIAVEYAEGKRELTPQQSLVNTLHNAFGRLASTDDKARYLYGVVSGDMEQIGLAEAELSRVESYSKPVAEFSKEGKQDPLMFGAAFFDGFASVLTSAIQSQATAGLGLASDMIGESIRSYNKQKAISNNISEEDLYENGDAEIILPGIIGAFAYRMEKFGLGKISNAIKALPKGAKQFVANFLTTATTESLTEGGQFVAEELNKYIASTEGIDKDVDISNLSGKTLEILQSREFREAMYKGLAGGAGAYSGGSAYKALAGVKTDEQVKIQDEAYDKITKLRKAKQETTLTPEQKQAFSTAEDQAIEDIRAVNEEAAETLNNLTEEQVSEIEQLHLEQQSLNNQLINTVNSTRLTEEQKEIVISGLQKKFKKNVQKINEIKRGAKKPSDKKKTTSFDLSNEEESNVVSQKYDPTTESDKFSIIERAKKVQKALMSVIPDLNIVIHENSESFIDQSGVNEVGRGAFIRKQNTIHINLQEADNTTLAHEAFHALLRNAINKGKWEQEARKMFEAVLPDIKGTKLEQEIEDFISNYDENVQNEERLTELFGRFAESETQFKATTRQKVKDWVNKTARILNINKVFTDEDIEALEVKRVLNTLASKIAKGDAIETVEVAKLDSEFRKKIIKGVPINNGEVVGSVTIKGKIDSNGRDIALQLVNRLGVDTKSIKRGDIEELQGANAFVFAADQAVVGTIKSPTGVVHEFMGGFLYPYIDGTAAWAFTDEIAARKVLKKIKESDGVGLVMVQAPTGILGSNSFQEYAFKEIDNAIKKGVDPSFFIDRANKILKDNFKKQPMTAYMASQGLPTEVSRVTDLKTLLPYTGERKASYEARNNFYSKLFNATTEKETGIPRFDFGKDVKNRINQYGGLVMKDLVNDPALKTQEYGDIVSAIQFDKNSPVIDTRQDSGFKTHPSYPFVLTGKPIMVFNQGYDVRKIFPDYTAKPTKAQPKPKPLKTKGKPQAARSAMGGQPIAEVKPVTAEVQEVALQKIDKELSKNSGSTQVKRTVFTYKKVAKRIKDSGNIGSVLDYGAGLGLGTDEMSDILGTTVSSLEINVERWKGKRPPTYTQSKDIDKKFDNIVSLNVLNVVPKDVRDDIVAVIASKLKNGGRAYIGVRNYKNDIANVKNFEPGPEPKSIYVNRAGVGRVFQKGWDGNEFVEYITERLGDGYKVEKAKIAATGVIITKGDVALQKTQTLKTFSEDSKKFVKNLGKSDKKPLNRRVWNSIFDRMSDIKRVFSQKITGNKDIYNALVTKAGASSYAKELFKEAEKVIYGGLSNAQEDLLNQLIFAKRIVSINKKRIEKQVEAEKIRRRYGDKISKRQSKNVPSDVIEFYYDLDTETGSYNLKDFKPYVAVNSKNQTLDAGKAQAEIDALRQSDPKQFETLNERAEKYFEEFRKNLSELYKSGRINKGTYEYFRDVNYSPIRVLEKIFQDNKSLTQEEIDKTSSLYGMPAKDIMALSDRNENTILLDSRWMLAMSIAAVQKKRFNNLLMNKIFDAVTSNPSAFEGFATTVEKESKSFGFVPVVFYRKGVPSTVYMSEENARQLLDIRVDNKILDGIEKFTGAKLLKFFATGGNVAFVLSNAPIDLMNVALFTDVYNRTPLEKVKLISLAKVSFDFIKNSTKKMISDVRGKGAYKNLYEEFLRFGGGMDYLSQTGINKINKNRDTAYDYFLGSLAYLGTLSEQAVRVSVYDKVKKDKISEYRKKNGVNPTGADLDNILFEAAAQARETIDFAQGGKLSKQIDKGIPYFNALVQSIRRPIDYARQKPKDFANSLAQVTSMGAALPFMNYFLAGLIDDEDEEDILKELRENTSKYEKANYYQIINPFQLRDKNGNLNYIRIRKLPTISFLSSVAEESVYSQITGQTFDNSVAVQSAKANIPFTGGIVDLAGSNPMMSAFLAYYLNYDLFRGQPIVRRDMDKPIKAYAEGLEDDDVSVLYKAIATLGGSVGVDISPKRLQAAVEKVITSPNTNPMIGLLYGGAETIKQLKNNNVDVEFILKPLEGFFNGFEKRLYRQTNPNVKKFRDKDAVLERIQENNTDEYLRNKRANNEMSKLIDEYGVGNLPKKLPNDFIDYIKNNFDKKDHKRMIDKYTRRLRSSVIDGIFFDIAYERNATNQAEYMLYLYGPTMSPEEKRELQRFVKQITGRNIQKKAFIEYKKLSE